MMEEQLARLSRGYAGELPRRVNEMEAALHAFLASTIAGAGETMDRLRRHVHQLKGSGTTFGFGDITRVARDFEAVLEVLSRQALPPSAAQQAQLSALVAELRALAEQARDRGGDPS